MKTTRRLGALTASKTKLSRLKDSHHSTDPIYGGFPGTTKAAKSMIPRGSGTRLTVPTNLAHGALAVIQSPGRCQLWAGHQTPALAFCWFSTISPQLGPAPTPTNVHEGGQPAVGAGWCLGWLRGPPAAVPRPQACPAPSRQDFCIPFQLSGTTSASPGTNTAAQIRCHHSSKAWLSSSPGTPTSPSQRATRACRILCPHFLSQESPEGLLWHSSRCWWTAPFGFHVYIVVVVNLREAFYFRHPSPHPLSLRRGGKMWPLGLFIPINKKPSRCRIPRNTRQSWSWKREGSWGRRGSNQGQEFTDRIKPRQAEETGWQGMPFPFGEAPRALAVPQQACSRPEHHSCVPRWWEEGAGCKGRPQRMRVCASCQQNPCGSSPGESQRTERHPGQSRNHHRPVLQASTRCDEESGLTRQGGRWKYFPTVECKSK